jgi:peptide/nickel transport system substrate-binding protein
MPSQQFNAPLSRRELLRYGATGLAAISVGSTLAGCADSSANSPVTQNAAGKPRKGGTLHAGLTGGSPTDTLDAAQGINNTDFARIIALYDPLLVFDTNAQQQNALAESVEPNATATVWTIRLKPGLTFHNGKPVTAEDVLYTLNRTVVNHYPAAADLARIDLKNARILDSRTLELPCSSPFSILDQELASNCYYLGIVPTNYDPKHPVGTGPFKYQSFTPGQQSIFTANRDYWDRGSGPYADTLVITDFTDETSQLNALQSGQVNLVNQLSAVSIPAARSAGQVLIAQGGAMTPFVMRCDRPPFNDVRVRQAMRLVVDRPQMNNIVFGGHGTIGNDIFSPEDPDYDRSLPQRVQDIEQAKSLLAAAGQSGLTVQLVVAPISYGTLEAAQVFAQQAKKAGITVNLSQITVTEMFGPNFLKWEFSMDTWYYEQYLPNVGNATVPSAPYDETHFDDNAYNKLYAQALATVDATKRRDIAHEMQEIDYTTGGYIIPYFVASIDGYAKNVHGVVPAKTGVSLGNFNFKGMWLA